MYEDLLGPRKKKDEPKLKLEEPQEDNTNSSDDVPTDTGDPWAGAGEDLINEEEDEDDSALMDALEELEDDQDDDDPPTQKDDDCEKETEPDCEDECHGCDGCDDGYDDGGDDDGLSIILPPVNR